MIRWLWVHRFSVWAVTFTCAVLFLMIAVPMALRREAQHREERVCHSFSVLVDDLVAANPDVDTPKVDRFKSDLLNHLDCKGSDR